MINSAFGQNCTSLFSYGANFETVSFINQSSVSNAHYWWNFGDGTGSYYENPVHTYPETGKYFVTLFAKDTISNCTDYYELWINVSKYSLESCSTGITDSMFTIEGNDYLKIIDLSTNCGGYYSNSDGCFWCNSNIDTWHNFINWPNSRFLSRIQYYTSDTINGTEVIREAYMSVPYLYTSAINYDDCSANFEYTVVQEDAEGQTVFFKAMNDNADFYEWSVLGYGNPIDFYTDTMSFYFPFSACNLRNVRLKIEGSGGCQDTLVQQLHIRPGLSTVVGIEERIKNLVDVQVYPNPFLDQTTLTFENLNNSNYSLTLTTLNGKVVKSIDNITTGQITVGRENLTSGIYFYQLYSESRRMASGKVIIVE